MGKRDGMLLLYSAYFHVSLFTNVPCIDGRLVDRITGVPAAEHRQVKGRKEIHQQFVRSKKENTFRAQTRSQERSRAIAASGTSTTTLIVTVVAGVLVLLSGFS